MTRETCFVFLLLSDLHFRHSKKAQKEIHSLNSLGVPRKTQSFVGVKCANKHFAPDPSRVVCLERLMGGFQGTEPMAGLKTCQILFCFCK